MAQQVKINRKNLIFVGFDSWDRAVYKYKNKFFKDVFLKGNDKYIPNVLNDVADNTFDGEPNNPYNVID